MSVCRLVDRVIAAHPERIAVVDDSTKLTYRELAVAAGRVARMLADRGVRPGDLVGLSLSRSAGCVAAMLGVLRAGAAYLPVDPAEPVVRTKAGLDGLDVRLLLTDAARFGLGLPQVLLPALPDLADLADLTDPAGLLDAPHEDRGGEHPCNVMFTSGSTGTPKAVLVAHRGVTTLVSQPQFTSLMRGAVLLSLAPTHFDAATFDIWGTLCNGATVVIAAQSVLGAGELRDMIRRYQVSVLNPTAGLFRVLADERPDCFAGLGWLLTGGDVISAAHVREVSRRLPELRIVGNYGPTEGTVFTSNSQLAGPGAGPVGATVPLGDPLLGRRMEILDAGFRPVPDGAAGELFVGGTGLALGYLGRPAETAERFVPDPGSDKPGERLYRTGDIVIRRDDKSIDFLGRADDQLKIRGVRVEPAEVAAALATHRDVRDAVVLPRGEAGQQTLVAYLTGQPGRDPAERVLREFLRTRLPAAMIPSMFVTLDRFPVTGSGKVDRAALRKAATVEVTLAATEPASPAELVRQTWRDCLERDIEPDANIFELGAHSLMALRVAARLERTLGRPVPVRAILEHPTARSLAGWLAEPANALTRVPSPKATATHSGRWALSPAQSALWFLDNFNPNSSFYVVGLGLMFTGPLDCGALDGALRACVRRHETLRARFGTVDGRPYQEFVSDQPGGLALLDLSGEPAHVALRELRRRFDELAGLPFDLSAQQPLRAELVRVAADRHALLLAVHHIVFDAWSTGLLLSELSAGYSALARGQRHEPAPPSPSFGQVAERQAAAIDTRGTAAALAHWRRILDGAPRLELPTDLTRPKRRGFTGAITAADIDARTGQQVRRLAGELGATPFMVLTAAFCLLLAQWSGRQDLVIGVPLSGRSDPDTHDLIGFCTSTLPLRVNLAGARSFREAVLRVREPALDLLTHQDLPFPLLVQELAPPRAGNRNPYYDITFQHLPAPEAGASFDGLSMELMPSDWHTAQFDLSCDVYDAGDGLRVQCEFSTELFSMNTINRQLERYVWLLREAVADPGRLPRPRPPARAVVPAAAAVWAEGGLGGIVAARAARDPDAAAVRCDDTTLSYGQLDRAAAQLAGTLAAAGVGSGDRVGLLLNRGLEVPVAVLGVLRAGAAYVPVDPQTPAARVADLLEAAGCRVVIRNADIKTDGTPRSQSPVQPGTPAYVIFTSGSTGTPKPVVVQHGAALALAAAAAEVYELTEADVVGQISSLAVDVSVEEMFPSWQAGATVVLASREDEASLSAFAKDHGVTVLNLAAPLWHAWVRELTENGERVPEGVRLVVTGSDRLDPDLVRAWHDGPGRGVRLLNAYGTTETAVSSAWYDTAGYRVDARHTASVPIGTAFRHARLYVLDDELAQVPDGVPGELYLGGPGVALGYLGQPAATASRFVPDPADVAGSRMYRTGDRVRLLPTGVLEFLGRDDDQVKVHGYRIELAEVERAAAAVPGVGEFAAAARAGQDGTARLVGYVRPARSATLDGTSATLDGTSAERVAHWRDVHDAELFNEAPDGTDPALHTGGWISSYTMAPIPEAAMRQWRDATLRRLRTPPATRVLEIGCGTGMILLRLAPDARGYIGTDISPRALDYVSTQVSRLGLTNVRLVQAPADDLAGVRDALDGTRPDLVVLNSVIQYFPSADYLERVLAGAWELLRPGGRLFIGDVRDLASLPLFHLSVLAEQAGLAPAAAGASLAGAAAERAGTDPELCVDPRFFHALAAGLDDLAAVDVQVKHGRADTEMNWFRYDVTLWRGPLTTPPAPGLTVRSGAQLDAAALRAALESGTGMVLTGVADARLSAYTELPSGLHPDDVRDIAASAGYAAAIRPAGPGRVDVALLPAGGQPGPAAPDPVAAGLDRGTLTNDPLRAARNREIADALYTRLRERLPGHMVPGQLVFVAEIPRTQSGKVDRGRLPDPPAYTDRAALIPPRTELERVLCSEWEQALGLPAIGIGENFFAIGGDSLTWLRIVSRLRRLGVDCDVRAIFEHQTVEDLAQAMSS